MKSMKAKEGFVGDEIGDGDMELMERVFTSVDDAKEAYIAYAHERGFVIKTIMQKKHDKDKSKI